jgi:putative heme-binding domain-containing protein
MTSREPLITARRSGASWCSSVAATACLCFTWFTSLPAATAGLEADLRGEDQAALAARVRLRGDARRGAVLFHTSAASCSRCHAVGDSATPLGPDLSTPRPETGTPDAAIAHVVASLLDPSARIREGYETLTIQTVAGEVKNGLLVREASDALVLRTAENLLEEIVIPRDEIDAVGRSNVSMMPAGLVDSLADEREFLDLARYVAEVAYGGPEQARALAPDPEALEVVDDTVGLDHAGILGDLDQRDFNAGRTIFANHCVNCHGADGNEPRLPTARAFGRDTLKFGSDPYRMFLTVSRGAGLMGALQNLSPLERYQVVHYVREGLMKDRNPQYQPVDEAYLASLPEGSDRGDSQPVVDRDYGPVLGSQLGHRVNNGLTVRLPDALSVCYDLHRMRLAAAWQGGFLDLSETHHQKQRGEQMPQIDGDPLPGLDIWQWAFDGSFDTVEDNKPPRGPLRADWLTYHGYYLNGERTILSYAIEGREVLESIEVASATAPVTLAHSLTIGPGQALTLCVGQMQPGDGPVGLLTSEAPLRLEEFGTADRNSVAIVTGELAGEAPPQPFANSPRHLIEADEAEPLDLGTPGRTLVVRFRGGDGTLVASTPKNGIWKPDGKTLFVRGGRLVFDIGWVGAISGTSNVADGQWHTAALVVKKNETRLYVDGVLEARRGEFRRPAAEGFVLKIGATATNFGGDYRGDIAWVRLLDAQLSDAALAKAVGNTPPEAGDPLLAWQPAPQTEPMEAQPASRDEANWGWIAAATLQGDTDGCSWSRDKAGRLVLTIPADDQLRNLRIIRSTLAAAAELAGFRTACSTVASSPALDLASLTDGGPLRWPEALTTSGIPGSSINGYALDTVELPFENPWNAWLRTSALDFFDDGRCVVTTHGGDVYIVSGLDDDLEKVTWKRFAAGLFEPFGVRVVDGQIYVTCHDGLKRLHDFNADGEADFIEAFWNDDDVSSVFHAYSFDLQTDSQGNFYLAKAGQHTDHGRPGSIMRIPPEGGSAEVVAWGIRTPNGMGILPDDRLTVSDNQGPWMPASKISLIREGSFLGNMPQNDEQTAWLKARHGGSLPTDFEEPIVWMPQEVDSSSGGQVWAGDDRLGPLSGRLIHSSFGKGWLYTLSLQEIGETMQGTIIPLPHQWSAGVMRLRINPADGQLYGVGLSGWQGPRNGLDGCLERLRFTGEPVQMVERVEVVPEGIELTFSFDVDPASVQRPGAFDAEMWNYLWSKRYGSDQFSIRNPEERGHDPLAIETVEIVSPRQLRLVIPDLAICDQLQLSMLFSTNSGQTFTDVAYLTIHAIPE